MMGVHQSQVELFSYRVNLEHRVRRDHPLRRVAAVIDFTFVRAEVARFYGQNGNVGIDPVVLLKLMFLLFFDDVASERELMERLPERLDYLWFLGYGLEDPTPNHSVSKQGRPALGPGGIQKGFHPDCQAMYGSRIGGRVQNPCRFESGGGQCLEGLGAQEFP
jgi:hypothetical protein